MTKFQLPVNLNPPQRAAAEHTTGPLLVLAGAGSGKTRVLACRTAYLIHSGAARSYQILALTFTNKAAGELKTRVMDMAGEPGASVFAGTFHSIFARLMRMEGKGIGIDPSFTIMDMDDARRLVKQIMNELGISTDTTPPARVHGMISSAKNKKIGPEEFGWNPIYPLEKAAALVYPIYQRRLEQMSNLDFDDLLIKPLEAFDRYPSFLERLQNRFHYVMVDEFQDTNPVQYELVKRIALKHRNIGVVGDDDQSIYGFRGATIGNILNFEKDWRDAKVIRLEQNYRSTAPILEAAWSVINNNQHRHEKKLWTEKTGGQPVDLLLTENDEDEARRFITIIDDEHRFKARPYRQAAILYRTNAQSQQFERHLRSTGIPYKVIGGLRFYERKEVKDVLAYIRVTVNPADDISLARIINYPPRGISDDLVKQMRDKASKDETTLFQIVRAYATDQTQPGRRRKSLSEFVEMIDGFAKLAGEVDFPLLATEIVVHTGLKERLKDEEKEDRTRAESKVANLDMLLTEIHSYWAESTVATNAETTPQARISAYLEEISLITDADKNDVTEDFVSLMTLHSAKGLEFPVVLIGGVEEGLIPYIPMDGKDADTEEERRLFYVGITRAMERLILGSAGVRMKYGTLHYQAKSSFLREIPSNLLNVQDFSTVRAQTGALKSLPAQWRQGAPPAFYRRNKPIEVVAPPPIVSQQTMDPRLPRSALPFAPATSTAVQPPPSGNLLRGDDLRLGLLVRHHKYNLGVIVKFHQVTPDWEVVVDFDEVGKKILRLNYAKLEAAKG